MAVVGLAMAAQGEGSYVPPEGTETPAASREVRAEAALLPGDLRPGEVAEAPDAEAKATVGTYMDALAAGDWSKALFFVDVATLRKSLLERRLADLKAHNAGMSAKDLEEISATLQTRELDPGRVRGILAELWAKDGMKGMEWKTAAWRDIGELEEGAWLARVACRTTEGANKDVLVCLRKDEDGWMVATDLADRIFAAQPRRVAVPAEVPLPEAVKELAEGYWTDWRAGNWAGVRARMSERNREALDADVFAARCEALALQMGIPSEWKLEHCKQLRPGMLGLGYAVSARSEYQALMIAVMGPEGWALEDVQVRRAEPAPAAVPTAAPGGAARPYSSDFKAGGLKSDFKTKL
jgi:hypothetical protein